MRRILLVTFAAFLLASCGDEEEKESSKDQNTTTEAAAPTMTTIGALNLELPVAVPAEIPVPSDAKYIGENEGADPYKAVQFSTAMDAEALSKEVETFAKEIGGRFDPAIRQGSYLTEMDGTKYNVYAWVRTNEGDTLYEVGLIELP